MGKIIDKIFVEVKKRWCCCCHDRHVVVSPLGTREKISGKNDDMIVVKGEIKFFHDALLGLFRSQVGRVLRVVSTQQYAHPCQRTRSFLCRLNCAWYHIIAFLVPLQIISVSVYFGSMSVLSLRCDGQQVYI